MKRLLTTCLLALSVALLLPVAAQAQFNERAYAPENLRTLSYNDQVRVIGLEYSEQSNGRRIPDDQLRFYIDQVNRSNWGFSRIKQDIAQSLGGGSGWNPGPGTGPIGSITCESPKFAYRECRTGWSDAALTENISKVRCVEGQNWGTRNGVVWVNQGCAARFVEAAGGGQTIRCESPKFGYRECQHSFRSEQVMLTRQISKTACVEGSTWGVKSGKRIWVDRGCAAEFSVGRGPVGGGYTITCSSEDERRRTCAWNNRYGRPVLIEQLSRHACREGVTWGYLQNQVWVDRGCRARFGVR